jgi:hypothetical protein
MIVFRKKPEIGETKSPASNRGLDDDSCGCILMPLVIVVAYFVTSAVVHSIYGTGTKFEQVICYGTLICLVLIMLVGIRDAHRENKAVEAERKRWAEDCTTASLAIVRRHEAISWWDDYSYRYRNAPNSLELEMNSDQKAVSPNQTIIKVEVRQYVYDRLKKCSTVHIYYKPETPLIFLLEDEL